MNGLLIEHPIYDFEEIEETEQSITTKVGSYHSYNFLVMTEEGLQTIRCHSCEATGSIDIEAKYKRREDTELDTAINIYEMDYFGKMMSLVALLEDKTSIVFLSPESLEKMFIY